MKVLKNLITLVILLGFATQINAQADTRCKDKFGDVLNPDNPKDFYINTKAAKSQDGAKYNDFTIYARPKKNDVALLEITQKGTLFKGVYSQNRTNVNDNTATCDLCAYYEFKSGSFSLERMQGGRVRWYIAEAKPPKEDHWAYPTITHRILNFEELDQDHDWEIRWND